MTVATITTPQALRRRPSGRTSIIIVLVCLLLVGAVAVGVHWWRTPDVFNPVDQAVGEGRSQLVAQSTTFGMSYVKAGVDDSKSLSVISARPNVLVNTANAKITVGVCTPDLDRAGAIGIVGAIHRECTRLVPADGATMRLTQPTDQLVLTIAPTQPGIVLVKGLHVTYSHGWQRGSQDLGQFVRVHAR